MKMIPVLYKRKEDCCGCTACYGICPKDAISMIEDKNGFEYPEVDADMCVRCYMCLKVCPIKITCGLIHSQWEFLNAIK